MERPLCNLSQRILQYDSQTRSNALTTLERKKKLLFIKIFNTQSAEGTVRYLCSAK